MHRKALLHTPVWSHSEGPKNSQETNRQEKNFFLFNLIITGKGSFLGRTGAAVLAAPTRR